MCGYCCDGRDLGRVSRRSCCHTGKWKFVCVVEAARFVLRAQVSLVHVCISLSSPSSGSAVESLSWNAATDEQ